MAREKLSLPLCMPRLKCPWKLFLHYKGHEKLSEIRMSLLHYNIPPFPEDLGCVMVDRPLSLHGLEVAKKSDG